jgi:nicotinamidase-related amidase
MSDNTSGTPGFAGSSGYGQHPAVVVVDFTRAFTQPGSDLSSDYSSELEATLRLLEFARKRGWPIFFTTVEYESHFLDGGYFLEKVPALKQLVKGSALTQLDERLQRRPDSEPLVVKKFASAFFGTPLASMLSRTRVDTVLVTGCTTSGCVRATAVDALQYGYRVVVASDCVGDRTPSAHAANLFDLAQKYADVVSSVQVMEVYRQRDEDGLKTSNGDMRRDF